MPRHRKYEKKSFESTGSSSDTSANIYMSMLISTAWQDLTPRQQVLYVHCKAQLYGQKTADKEALFKAYDMTPPSLIDPFFSMNIAKFTKTYQLYSPTNLACFYRDMESLIGHGFVKCIACGAVMREKSLYAFSDKWHLWNTPEFKILPKEMTSSMLRKRKNNKDKPP